MPLPKPKDKKVVTIVTVRDGCRSDDHNGKWPVFEVLFVESALL